MNLPVTSISLQIAEWAAREPDREAIVSSDFCYSYANVYAIAIKESLRLKSLGIPSDTLIGIHCAHEVKHLLLTLAAAFAGLPSITIPTFEESLLPDQLKTQNKSLFVIGDDQTDIDLNAKYDEVRDISLDSIIVDSPIYFATSGSTGQPKLVKHSTVTIAQQAARHIPEASQRFLCLASVEHNFSKRHRLYCLSQGAVNVFVRPGLQDFVKECSQLAVNVMHLTAYQAQELMALEDVSQLNGVRVKLGGSNVNLDLRERLRKSLTSDIQFGYGTTETGAISFTDPQDNNAGCSVGKALPGISVKIVNNNRDILVQEEIGEIAIKGEGMFLAYNGLEKLYARQLSEEWFYTKDLGYLDKEGRIHVTGRADNMFVFNSINIYPEEIETKLLEYGGIQDVAVVPHSSNAHGAIPVALVVFDRGADASITKLQRYSQKVNGVRSPRLFVVVDSIPRKKGGKMARAEAALLGNRIGDVKDRLCESIKAQPALLKKVADQLERFGSGVRDIDLEELALESIERMELLVTLELEFDTVITLDELTSYRYLSDVVKKILSPGKKHSEQHFLRVEQVIGDVSAYKDHSNFTHLINVFKRAINGCNSLTDLNKLLTLIERKVTPEEFVALWVAYQREGLLNGDVENKYEKVIEEWLSKGGRYFSESGKGVAEKYEREKISSALTLFKGEELRSNKTLVIGFSGRGDSCLDVPNFILLQHARASHYDFLMVSEPRGRGYLEGIPFIGDNEKQVVDWIANHKLLADYKRIRVAGVSAGAYPAMLLGFKLESDLTLSLAGRFHRFKRNPRLVLRRVFGAFLVRVKRSAHNVKYCYSNSSKDRRYALLMSRLTRGEALCIRYPGVELKHRLLYDMLRVGKLKCFLEDTLLRDVEE